MPRPFVFRGPCVQGSPCTVLGYLTCKIAGGPEQPLTADLVASLAYVVTRLNDDGTSDVIASGSITPDNALLDPPVTDDTAWPIEQLATGYNWQHELSGDWFPTGAVTYRVQYSVTLAAGGTIYPAPLLLTAIPSS